jgi:hypothetical protein
MLETNKNQKSKGKGQKAKMENDFEPWTLDFSPFLNSKPET